MNRNSLQKTSNYHEPKHIGSPPLPFHPQDFWTIHCGWDLPVSGFGFWTEYCPNNCLTVPTMMN